MAIVLGYWDARGISEGMRNLLRHAKVDFEDRRHQDRETWTKEKPTLGLDFPNLPYLLDGDVKLTQSKAIFRYLGRKYDFYGKTEAEVIRADLAEQQINDYNTEFSKLMYVTSKDKYPEDKEAFLKALPQRLQLLSDFLGDRKWIVGEKLTYVDFIVYEFVDVMSMFAPDVVEKFPKLQAYIERFDDLSGIKEFRASGKYDRTAINGPQANWGAIKCPAS